MSHSERLELMHVRREGLGTYRGWREEVVGLIHRRRIFVATDGGMGMAPQEARKDDLVCIIHGAPVPFILRRMEKADDELYYLVGPCYLNNMMTREGFENLKKERRDIPDTDDDAFGRKFILV
jgi:hypothetical protein